ncbi:MAG: anti-anti-sigma factor [Chitinophagaceae bacterium]|jgi:anti-anti-sigma factor
MNFKIDTKEVFHVIIIEEKDLSANMAAELENFIAVEQQKNQLSLILNFKNVAQIDPVFLNLFLKLKSTLSNQQKSFVVCELSSDLQKQLGMDKEFEGFHLTPTESEAWDIVQMEEIERELGLDI